jgi:hypothetical protein
LAESPVKGGDCSSDFLAADSASAWSFLDFLIISIIYLIASVTSLGYFYPESF